MWLHVCSKPRGGTAVEHTVLFANAKISIIEGLVTYDQRHHIEMPYLLIMSIYLKCCEAALEHHL